VEGDTPGTTPIMTRYSDPAVYAGIYYDTILPTILNKKLAEYQKSK